MEKMTFLVRVQTTGRHLLSKTLIRGRAGSAVLFCFFAVLFLQDRERSQVFEARLSERLATRSFTNGDASSISHKDCTERAQLKKNSSGRFATIVHSLEIENAIYLKTIWAINTGLAVFVNAGAGAAFGVWGLGHIEIFIRDIDKKLADTLAQSQADYESAVVRCSVEAQLALSQPVNAAMRPARN